MESWRIDNIALTIIVPFMKIVGCWPARDSSEERLRFIMRIVTAVLVGFLYVALVIEAYFVRDPFYFFVNILDISLAFFKMMTLFIYRSDFLKLITLLVDKFLALSNYDAYEKDLLITCKRFCGSIIFFYTSVVHTVIVNYVVTPIIAHSYLNDSERFHIFKMGFPIMSVTPYYELMYVLQVVAFYQSCVCYFAVDNLLYFLNLQISCQFRILQYRLRTLKHTDGKQSLTISEKYSKEHYPILRECIQQHQDLISYADTVANIYSVFSLIQTITYSFLICLNGYNALLVNVTFVRRLLCILHTVSTSWQLFMFCYGGDGLKRESANIDTAVYASPWTNLKMNNDGRMLRRAINIVVLRSRVPCSLSGCGFFDISLETFIKVCSTAMSYFALINETSN